MFTNFTGKKRVERSEGEGGGVVHKTHEFISARNHTLRKIPNDPYLVNLNLTVYQ